MRQKEQPYVYAYQEYPKHLNWPDGTFTEVRSAEEEASAIAAREVEAKKAKAEKR